MPKKIGILIVALGVIGFGAWFYLKNQGPVVPTLTIETDTTLAGDYSVPAGTKVVVKNGATVTVEGDLLVAGSLACDGGPLNLIVKGTFTADRHIQCDRASTLPSGDIGSGITVVASSFQISKAAVIVSNGHVQMVSDASKIAKTQAEIDALYAEAAQYRAEKFHIGPMVPVEQIPAGTPGLPVSLNRTQKIRVAGTAQVAADRNAVSTALVPSVQAQNEEPAEDIEGNPIPGAVRIGGKWIIGRPDVLPPFELTIPTPPPGIKKIILNFDFGGKNMVISDFDLSGPDGRPGEKAEGGCAVTGGKGEEAMRMTVRASNITVNNFNLHLGSGGDGGRAETDLNCDPGVATGGTGGSSGNFKMIAEEGFEITGEFNIYPGKGGTGGEAIAHGKTGEDGCAGIKGGDATATGGKGGDNKKLLTVTGTISGTENITINEMVGGTGGTGDANGGNGGNGTGPACDGGPGGSATATGGKGGDTTCAKFPCTGGNGGGASATPGNGGKGGQGSTKDPGGNGGDGGNADGSGGAGGTGKTANGIDGTVVVEKGGDGGNGGDGCGPGGGGNGGSGDPDGNPGKDGKNLCVTVNNNMNAVQIPSNTNVNENTNTGSNQNSNNNTNQNSNGNTKTNDGEETEEMVDIQVIQYNGKYLPVAQLIVENEEGCDGGTAHWHAAQGVVIATDGSQIFDPGPDCGYGKTKDKPVMTVKISAETKMELESGR